MSVFTFPIYQIGSRSLKKRLAFEGFGGRIATDASDKVSVTALRDVSISLQHGDRLALVGATAPVRQRSCADGRRLQAQPWVTVGDGPRSQCSIWALASTKIDDGYDNIRLRGQLLGLTLDEIDRRLPEIGAFTELGDYLNMPVRTYSSGMMLRMMFAVATSFAPDILLMDEWIIAGDARFIARAEKRISSFISHSSILVLASHQLELLQRWCTKALWLDRGQVRALGPTETVIEQYRSSVENGLTPDPSIEVAAVETVASN